MRVTRGVRLALGLAAVAIGGGASTLILTEARAGFSEVELAVSVLAGWSFIGSGLLAWTRRPENRTGPLLMLVGLTFFAGLLNSADHDALNTLGAWVRPLHFVVFRAVLLRVRLARASVADVVVELENTRAPGALRHALARALSYPTLELAYWLPGEQRYVDIDGQSVELPGGH